MHQLLKLLNFRSLELIQSRKQSENTIIGFRELFLISCRLLRVKHVKELWECVSWTDGSLTMANSQWSS